MNAFHCPEFTNLDKELIEDFRTTQNEAQEEIEDCLYRLNQETSDAEIHRLFRAMHSLKGNCRMVSLDPLVELLHDLEEIAGDLRQGEYDYRPELGEFISEVVEYSRELVRQLVERSAADESLRRYLIDRIHTVRSAPKDRKADACRQALAELIGDSAPETQLQSLPDLPPDLVLMKDMALQLDNLSIYRRGRSEQVLHLAGLLNTLRDEPVDTDQLTAAIYLHDMGMAMVPSSIVQKQGELSREELNQVQMHIHLGSRLLQRFGGWEDAATMVMQHHERFDGRGYPNRLKAEQIHLGARMIAIADSFCAMTNERHDRSYRKTLFSAVREINAEAEGQFDPDLVEAFNEVIRQHYLAA